MLLFKSFYRVVIFLFLTFIMIGCVSVDKSLSEEERQEAWKKHQQQLRELTSYQARGSLAYSTDHSKYYGGFFLNQTSDNEYQLKLTSPIGTSIFSLVVTPYLAQLTDSDGKKYIDENVERLMLKLTNMDIPFKSLHDWFKGFSDTPNHDKLDGQGRLLETVISQEQQNWFLTINKYKSYQYKKNFIDLPSTIELRNSTNTHKVTIKNWKLE